MKFNEYLEEKFTKEGKHVKTFTKGNKWCRVGKVSRKEWSVVTDDGLYDTFGNKADALRYAEDYVNKFQVSKHRQTDDLNKGWL